jgi:hypothetical protein
MKGRKRTPEIHLARFIHETVQIPILPLPPSALSLAHTGFCARSTLTSDIRIHNTLRINRRCRDAPGGWPQIVAVEDMHILPMPRDSDVAAVPENAGTYTSGSTG